MGLFGGGGSKSSTKYTTENHDLSKNLSDSQLYEAETGVGHYQSGAKPFFGGSPKLWPLAVVAVVAVIILKPKLKKK